MAFKFNNATRQAPQQPRYATLGRSSLLSIILFSIINMISLPLSGSHFLFSAYFPFYASAVGTDIYLNDGSISMLLLFSAVGLVLLTPYILCYVFSPRHAGWMIGATVMFIIESLFAVGDAVLMLAAGNSGLLADALIHLVISVMLILAAIDGVRRSRAGLPLTVLTPAELGTADTPIADTVLQNDAPAAEDATAQEPSAPTHSDAVEQERTQKDNRWE